MNDIEKKVFNYIKSLDKQLILIEEIYSIKESKGLILIRMATKQHTLNFSISVRDVVNGDFYDLKLKLR